MNFKASKIKTLMMTICVMANGAMAWAQISVEKNPPNANFTPAFKGQTRVAAVKTQTPLQVNIIAKGLLRPWGICVLPSGGFLISEKEGTMAVLAANGKFKNRIKGLPAVDASGQGGLLDITLDSKFATSRVVYWAFSEPQKEGILLAIAKGNLSADEKTIVNQKIIYRATPAHTGTLQYGARIVIDNNGNLFVSTGERSDPEIRIQAQHLNSSLGKILHLTPEGKAVLNGPFAKTPGARPEIYAYGLRNPDGLAFNPTTGDLWEAEFGPRGGDEINIIKPGHNYGWPIITYGIEYSGDEINKGITAKEGMTQPVYYWNPSMSPGSIAFYNSSVISEWKGNLFVGALSGSHIARLVIKNDKIVGEERLLENRGERFRDLVEGKDGALYAITDNGNLFKIAKK